MFIPMMNNWLLKHCMLLLSLLCSLPCCFSQDGQRQAQASSDNTQGVSGADQWNVLQNLSLYDSIYKAGFTVSATQDRMDRLDVRGPFFHVQASWRLTFEGQRTGYVVEVTDYENPKYVPSDQRTWGNPATVGKDVMLASVRTKEWGYWGEEASGNHLVEATLELTPEGKATEIAHMHNAYLFAPRDISLIAAQRSFQWALGRFFSDRLDKVTRVEKSAEGRLHVSAVGNIYNGVGGRWELEIEPDAAWIVRKAKFYPQSKPDQLAAEMTNDGSAWNGSFCIPKAARVNFWGPIESMETVRGTMTQHFAFESIVDEFDEKLYKQCQQGVLHGDQSQLTVTDGRVSPQRVFQPNRPDPAQGPVKDQPVSFGLARQWLVIGNLAVVFLLVVIFVLRKRKISSKTSQD